MQSMKVAVIFEKICSFMKMGGNQNWNNKYKDANIFIHNNKKMIFLPQIKVIISFAAIKYANWDEFNERDCH